MVKKTAKTKKRNPSTGASRKPDNRPGAGVAASFHRLALWFTRTLVVCTLGAVVFSGVYFARHLVERASSRPVNSVRIEGEFVHIPRQQLADMISPLIDDGFLKLPLEEIKAKLEVNAWVASAALSRRWPDTLVVVVIEQQPIARWRDRGFVNHKGEVVEVAMTPFLTGLPALVGNPGQEKKMMRDYQQLAQLLRPYGLGIAELHCDPLMSWRLVLKNGVLVTIGRDQIMEKMQRFLMVYQRVLKQEEQQISSIDLRYGNGLAVKWKEATVDSEKPDEKQNNNA